MGVLCAQPNIAHFEARHSILKIMHRMKYEDVFKESIFIRKCTKVTLKNYATWRPNIPPIPQNAVPPFPGHKSEQIPISVVLGSTRREAKMTFTKELA